MMMKKKKRLTILLITALHLGASALVYMASLGQAVAVAATGADNVVLAVLALIILSPLAIIVFLGMMFGQLIEWIGDLITEFFELAIHPIAVLLLAPVNSFVCALLIMKLAQRIRNRSRVTEHVAEGDN